MLPLVASLPGAAQKSAALKKDLPPIRREFRGVWISSVANIDWPSEAGLPAEKQQAELKAMLDKAVEVGLNAVVLQVRPSADAIYPSTLEPWTEFLSGTMGKPPSPMYDPLAFAVEEAHKRGLELHAWFNPYRARYNTARGSVSPDHVSRKHPDWVRTYGRYMWLDPGHAEASKHSRAVIVDVVKRYDIDGVHLDDYFYPYPIRDKDGKLVPFPDEPTWQAYVASGGKLVRDDWRRENIHSFVRNLYWDIKAAKIHVKFGISPFGIWRPGNPPQIKGMDPYEALYADSRKWLQNGWVDYFTPQLYWRIDPPAQSYPVLLEWWTRQNTMGRHLWPGNFAGLVGGSGANAWKASELVNQIDRTRKQPGASGNVHFSVKAFMRNSDGLNEALIQGPYGEPAIPPATPWLDDKPPAEPVLVSGTSDGRSMVAWSTAGEEPVWLWTVRTRKDGTWSAKVLPHHNKDMKLEAGVDAVAVTAVDRCGNESEPAVLDLGS